MGDITIKQVPTSVITKRKTNNLDMMIYTSFKKLSHNPKLSHNLDEIGRLLGSPNSVLVVVNKLNNPNNPTNPNKTRLCAYLLGEVKKLNDGRNVFFITYIYVSGQMRAHGIGNKLLAKAESICKEKNLSGIMLICDTSDSFVLNWYQNKGYMEDLYLRNYSRYDVFFKDVF